jgi:hypothetical protein
VLNNLLMDAYSSTEASSCSDPFSLSTSEVSESTTRSTPQWSTLASSEDSTCGLFNDITWLVAKRSALFLFLKICIQCCARDLNSIFGLVVQGIARRKRRPSLFFVSLKMKMVIPLYW